jgi:hypothetical protein
VTTAKKKRRPAGRQKPDESTRLGSIQQQAIEAELQGERVHAIRARLKIARSTWHRWHQVDITPHYVAELARRRTEASGEVVERCRSKQHDLIDARDSVLETLQAIMEDVSTDPGVRVRAADALGRLTATALEQAGYAPPPPPPPDQDAAASALRSMIEGVRAAIKLAGSAEALINAPPSKPSDDELDPFAALQRKDARIAELEEELRQVRVRG